MRARLTRSATEREEIARGHHYSSATTPACLRGARCGAKAVIVIIECAAIKRAELALGPRLDWRGFERAAAMAENLCASMAT